MTKVDTTTPREVNLCEAARIAHSIADEIRQMEIDSRQYQFDYNDDNRIIGAERTKLWSRHMVLHSVNLDAPRPDNDSD